MTESAAAETSKNLAISNHGPIYHLMVLTHFVVKDTLDRLVASKQYKKLSLTYERYFPVLVEGEISPGELAARVGASKQACSKVIKELEKQGFIDRHPNPEDGRSMLLSLSKRGIQLLKDGTRITAEVQENLAARVGSDTVDKLIFLLEQVCVGLGVELRPYPLLTQSAAELRNGRPTRLNILVQTLTAHMREALLDEMNGKGFEGLRTNFGQILGMIATEPRRIQYVASVIGISKQAAAVMAIEFETLGYVIRETDPEDKRQIILRLSPEGERLVLASINSVRALENRIKALLGESAYRQLEDILSDIYSILVFQLEAESGGDNAELVPEKIQRMTGLLIEELGVAGARQLARHLLTITRGDI